MEIPKGHEIPGHNSQDWVLHVSKNIHGQVWCLHTREKIKSIGFKVLKHDACVFFKGYAMHALGTDDSVPVTPNQREPDEII